MKKLLLSLAVLLSISSMAASGVNDGRYSTNVLLTKFALELRKDAVFGGETATGGECGVYALKGNRGTSIQIFGYYNGMPILEFIGSYSFNTEVNRSSGLGFYEAAHFSPQFEANGGFALAKRVLIDEIEGTVVLSGYRGETFSCKLDKDLAPLAARPE